MRAGGRQRACFYFTAATQKAPRSCTTFSLSSCAMRKTLSANMQPFSSYRPSSILLRIGSSNQYKRFNRRYCTSQSPLSFESISLHLSRSAFDGDFTCEEIGDNYGGEEEQILLDHLFTLLEKDPIQCPSSFLGSFSVDLNLSLNNSYFLFLFYFAN